MPRFARNQATSSAVARRTRRRMKRLSYADIPGGVNLSDGVTGAEARQVKRAAAGRRKAASNTVAQRTGARLAALGGSVKGVDGTDGYTRGEARRVKRARRAQKAGRTLSRLGY